MTEAEKSAAIAALYARTHDLPESGFQPDSRPDSGDYNVQWPNLAIPYDDEMAFFDAAEQIEAEG